MELLSMVRLYLIAVVVFFAVDMVWLGYLARGFYRNNLDPVVNVDINWRAAIVFYLIYIAGILIFAIVPALRAESFQKAVVWGAMFGFFTYATYDLTNMATIRNWPLKMVVVDILWGTVLSTTVATLTYLGGRWFQTG